MSETRKDIPVHYERSISPIRLTRRGKIAKRAAGLSLVAAAGVGMLIAQNGSDNDKTRDHVEQKAPIFYADHDTKNVKVRSGDGVDDVIQRAYGIDAPEGTNQVVQNNPEYSAEYQAVIDANEGSEELHPGKLVLPVDFYTQEEVDKMLASQQ